MKTPTEDQLNHMVGRYDPAKAHEYYMRTRKLHPRQKAAPPPTVAGGVHPRRAKGSSPRAKQKRELASHIQTLETKLQKLEFLIKKKEAVLKKNAAGAKAKANANKKTKSQIALKSKQYRQKHKQALKIKAKAAAAAKGDGKGAGAKGAAKPDSKKSIAELKTLATKVKGQIALAKQKLAAL